MKRGKALCRILAVLLICALVAGFAPVAETISAPAQETAAGAEPAETVTDVLPSGADGDPDAAKDPGETPNPGETKDPGETPDPSEPTNPGETPTVLTIVSAEDTTPAEWAQSRTVTIQTAGPADKVQYRVEGTKKWKDAAVDTDVEEGGYKFTIEDKSDKVVTYEVRALNTKDKQESKTVPVQVGKIDRDAPTVTPKDSYASYNSRNWTVTISDSQSGMNVDSIQIRAFYEKDGRQYLPETHPAVTALNQALETQKTNWKNDKNDKNGNFEVSFTLPKHETVKGKYVNKNYELYIEVKADDMAGNHGGYNLDKTPDVFGDIDCAVEPSLYDLSKGAYRVGDQSKLIISGVPAGKTVSVGGTKYEANADGKVEIQSNELTKILNESSNENGIYTIEIKSGTYKIVPNELPVYYVSGAPEFDGVTFENQSAFKSFVHTITGGLMFANDKKLIIKPKMDAAAGENTVGAAYFWQTGDAVVLQDNPALMLDDNGKVVLDSQDSQQTKSQGEVVTDKWAAVDDKSNENPRAPWLIPCPKDNDFSGYLHVVVWNEVGTCTQYVYKTAKVDGEELKLTNYGVFNGANNGVAVFVTTPVKDADGKPVKDADGKVQEDAYTATKEDEKPNWVQQVNFDVQWDKSALATWLENQYPSEDGTVYDWSNGTIDADVDVKKGNPNEGMVTSGSKSEAQKKFTIGANGDVSTNDKIQFTVTVSVTGVEKTTTTTDGSTTEAANLDPKSFDTEEIQVYVQNYLKEPTVTAVSETKTADGETSKATRTNKPEKDKEGKDDIEQCWFNGNDNVLKSLVITESGESKAPYTLHYSLQAPDNGLEMGEFKAENGALTVFDETNKWQWKIEKDDKKGDQPVYVNQDGEYVLIVWAEDDAGNISAFNPLGYTIKYDVSAPDVHAVFSEKADKDPFYKQQRTIDIKVSDKLFDGNKNVTFDEELKKPDQNQKDGDYTLTGKMTNPDQRGVSIETTIQYTNGNPPQFDGAWTYTGASEGKQTLPSWSGTYKYGVQAGAEPLDGDDYTLCIKATDEAGNVTKTDAKGKCTQNGQENDTFCAYTFKGDKPGDTDFTIDQTNPKVSVRFDNNSVVNGKYFPAGRTATITVVEHNFYDKGVNLTATGASGRTKWVDDGDTHTATVSFLNDADCKFAIEVTDKAGNICKNDAVDYGGSAAPGEFVIDTTAPTLALTGVNGPFADACTPGFEGQDANMSTEYELHLMRSVRENAADDATALCSRELVNISTTDIRAVFQNIPDMLDNAEYYSDGIYKLSVTIRDMADNTTTQEATFAVNRHGSFYIYGEALANLVTKQFAQNDFVDAQTGAWTIMEYNASPVQPDSVQLQIYRDNALVTSITPEIKGGMDDATGLYRYVYELDRNMFAQDGLYKVQVRSTDEAGNLSENIDEVDDNGNVTTPEKYQCTLSFVIDNVDPEFKQITGLEKRRYREDSHEINFAVADTYGLARVSVLSGETVVAEYLCAAEIDALGGETKLAANQKPMPDELTLESVSGDVMLQGGKSAQTITFVAVDKAGNTYTTGSADQKPLGFHQKVTISTNGFVLYIHNTWAVVLTVVALAAIAFGVWYGVSKKKKREGAAS